MAEAGIIKEEFVMYKAYCDICKIETKEDEEFGGVRRERTKGTTKGGVDIEFVVSYKGTFNSGNLCKECFLSAVQQVLEIIGASK